MKIQQIIGEQGPQTGFCANGGCPAFLFTDDNRVLIQGAILSESEKAKLTAPAHEDFVSIPREIFEKLTAHL
ncbi:hypothetical protein [Cerasicoccus arenae]|uniref:Uncharacterized protein n=1 Tax=Cerasicoccus arenae TaxID=424488 RepID=A0A8J3DFN3_9BACT|nr:hypothetical protein [Cerasicoccus arenae]MBK1859361.1 hypothetical protein [Cerasicoccus arenae]GHB93330.1 hypothetical protein GCM10007047_05880 [Cerasicoccus arenae]